MSTPEYVMEPPPGEVRTFDNPPTSGGGVIPAAIATTVIAFIVVCLRLFTRGYIMRGILGLDDYLVIISMALSIGFAIASVHLANLGCGLHMWDMKMADYTPPYMATTMGITCTYSTCVSFAKLSILVFYLRLSPEKPFRWAVFGLIGVVISYTITYLIVIFAICQPVALNWDLTLEGKCISRMAPMMVLSVANIVIDIAILVIPIKVVVPLQMPRRQKVSLIFLFATGGFVCAAAIYRTYLLPSLLNATDYTWVNPPQNIWGSIEANAGIICASVPALKPFFVRYLPFIISSRLRSGDASYPSNFDAYSTKADRNRKRRQDKSYALSSRDKHAPDNSFPTDHDDETHLWSRQNKDVPIGQAVTAVTSNDDSSDDGIPKDMRQWGGRSHAVDVKAGKPRKQSSHDIHVTRETKITYDNA